MSLLTQSYNLAMERYRILLSNQQSLNNNLSGVTSVDKSESTNKTDSTDKTESNNKVEETKKPSSSDKVNNESSFEQILNDAINKVTAGNTYDVGGYKITIPSLSDPNVQNRIKAYNIDNIITAASEKYDVPEALIYKVIETESYFKPESVSYVGATGLMQIMPFNNSSLGITDATDPYQNIMGGVKLLRQYLDMYDGDVKLGLAAYNAGPGNVNTYGGVPPFAETQNYIKKILGVEA